MPARTRVNLTIEGLLLIVKKCELKKDIVYCSLAIKQIYFLKANFVDLPFLKILLLACVPLRNAFCSSNGNLIIS